MTSTWYPAKISFISEKERFLRQKLRDFITSTSTLHRMLKEVLQMKKYDTRQKLGSTQRNNTENGINEGKTKNFFVTLNCSKVK